MRRGEVTRGRERREMGERCDKEGNKRKRARKENGTKGGGGAKVRE